MNVLKKMIKKLVTTPEKGVADLEYLLWLCNLYLLIKFVPGHIAEIGVAEGRNSRIFGHLIHLHGDSSIRKYYGFDTFSGYVDRDLATDTHLKVENFSNIDMDKVVAELELAGLSNSCALIEGDVCETVPFFLTNYSDTRLTAGMGKFALLYIDCNAYKPAFSSMESFLPHLSPGAVIAIDEKTQGSETKALYDFAEKHGFQVKYHGAGNVPALIQTT